MKPSFILESAIRLDDLFQEYRNRPALIASGVTQSFGDIEGKLCDVIDNLHAAGVGKGQRVALHCANSELHLYLFLASWIMDFLYIPLDFKAPREALLSDTPVELLVTNDRPVTDASSMVLQQKDVTKQSLRSGQSIAWPAIPFAQEASAIFTSGSTGAPRGIVHTVGNYVLSALGTNAFIGLDPSDRWLLSLPLFHVGGALIWMRTLLAGSACILPVSLQDLADSIRQHRPTVISLVPAQLIRFLEDGEMVTALKSMKTIMLGGAPSPDWLIERALDMGLPIMPTYGCTESCAQVTGVPPGSERKAYFTAGRAVPYRKIRIDVNGLIELGGETLFKRYLNDCPSSPFDSEGFFKTADSGTMDAQGNLVLYGRTDGVFISGGENISPPEIENALLKLDGILTAIVVPVPHREFGLIPWAFVETQTESDEKSILDQLRKDLPGYKLPKRILRLSPDDRQGKIKYSRQSLTDVARNLAEDHRQIRLHYEEAGSPDAPVIVFLHGFMGKARSWMNIMGQLSETYHCLAFDLPGHGSSLFSADDRLRSIRDINDTALLILEDLDILGIRHFALYGYSMGGRIAQHMAIAAADRIKCLILESASFGIADLKERADRLKKDQALLDGIKTTDEFRAFLTNWYKMPLFRTLPGTAHLQTLIDDKINHPVAEYQQAMNLLSVGGHDFLAAKLAACRFPIHYFCGELDEAYRQTAARTCSYLPGMTVRIFPNASHNISIQYPQEITRAICEILI